MASANQNAVSAKIFIAVVISVCVQGSTAAPKPGFTGNFNPPQNLGKGLGSLSTISGSQLEGMQLGGVSGLQVSRIDSRIRMMAPKIMCNEEELKKKKGRPGRG
jgi:hypothetical protein